MSVSITGATPAQLKEHQKRKDRLDRLRGRPPALRVTPREQLRGEATKPEEPPSITQSPEACSQAARDYLLIATLEDMLPQQIIRLVSLKHGIREWEILSVRRHKAVIAARHEAMCLVYQARPHWSLIRLARIFKRDHTTLLHALKKAGVYIPRIDEFGRSLNGRRPAEDA